MDGWLVVGRASGQRWTMDDGVGRDGDGDGDDTNASVPATRARLASRPDWRAMVQIALVISRDDLRKLADALEGSALSSCRRQRTSSTILVLLAGTKKVLWPLQAPAIKHIQQPTRAMPPIFL